MLVYFEGNEPFLAHLAIKQLKERYLAKNDGVELINIDASEGKINWVDLQATPLFSQTRLVILRNLSVLTTSEQESLASYLGNLPTTTIAVVWEGSKPLAKTSPLQPVFKKKDTKNISVILPSGTALKKHLLSRAGHYNLKLDLKVEQQLLEDFGHDLWALDNELAVLALGGQSSATTNQKTEPFALYRFVQAGNWPKAKETLRQEHQNGAPIELLVGSIASALRKKAVSAERLSATKLLLDIDAGIKTGLLDEGAAVALLSADLPKGRQNRVEWEQLWEESLGG